MSFKNRDICIFISVLFVAICGVSAAQEPAPVTLRNDFIEVVFDDLDAQLSATLNTPGGQRTFGKILLSESVVYETGVMRPVVGGKLETSDAESFVVTSHLPENPLIGLRPHKRIELPFYRQDRTETLRMKRTVRLISGSPVIEISTGIENTGDAPCAFVIRFNRHYNPIGDRNRSSCILPRFDGIGKPTEYPYEYDAPASWVAFISGVDTLVAEFDHAVTSCIAASRLTGRRELIPGGAVSCEITLQPGEEWRIHSRIYFIRGLGNIAGVADGIVGGITLPEPPLVQSVEVDRTLQEVDDEIAALFPPDETDDRLSGEGMELVNKIMPRIPQANRRAFMPGDKIDLTASLISPNDRDLELNAIAEHIASGGLIDLGKQSLALKAGIIQNYKFTFEPDKAGTWVIRLSAEGAPLPFEMPVDIDYPSGMYFPASNPQMDFEGSEFSRFRWERFRTPDRYDYFSITQPITTEMSTPHIPYARPMAGGPLRLLAVVPFKRARELVELKQRLDCEVDTVLIGSRQYIGPGRGELTNVSKATGPEDEAREMRRALGRKPEAILLGATTWNWFPADVQREILRLVAEDGVALVVASPLLLPDNFPQKANGIKKGRMTFPPSPQLPSVTSQFGEGKISVLPSTSSMPQIRGIFAHRSEMMEDLIRLLVRGSRGANGVRIELLNPGNIYKGGVTVKLTNSAETPFTGTLDGGLWNNLRAAWPGAYPNDPCGTPAYDILQPLEKIREPFTIAPNDQITMDLDLPAMPPGVCRIMIQLRNTDDEVVDWVNHSQKSENRLRIGDISIENPVDPDALRLYRRDTGRISFSITPMPERTIADGELRAFVRGLDRSGREVIFERAPLDPLNEKTVITMTVPLRRILHRHFVLVAGVEQNGVSIAEERRGVLVDRRDRRNDFRFNLIDNENWFPHTRILIDDFGQYGDDQMAVVDGVGQGYGGFWGNQDRLSPEEEERREREAIAAAAAAEARNAASQTTAPPDPLEELLRDAPEGIADLTEKDTEVKEVYIRESCFNNPENREYWKRFMVEKLKPISHGWPRAIYADDEYIYGTVDTCQCEHCQATFARYLENTYGTVERLNREYGASYEKFSDARLYYFGTGKNRGIPDKAPPREDWPRALDTLVFKAWQYRDAVREVRDHVREVFDPDFETGASGVYHMRHGNFFVAGNDHWQQSQIGFNHAVYRDYEEWSSFTGSSSVFCWQSGYGSNYNPSHQAWHPWHFLRQGHYGFGHFTAPSYPMASPDGTLHPGPEKLFQEIDKVRSGPAALLLGREVRDPVAIHWSGPSFYLNALELWHRHGETIVPVLRRANHSTPRVNPLFLRFFYISHEQLEQGVKTFWEEPKVLILNYSSAMSREEVEVVRNFVAEGGVIVGGIDTATRTEHGFPYETPPLDEVFGITREGGYQEVLDDSQNNPGALKVSVRLPGSDEDIVFNPLFVTPNLRATTAEAFGEFSMGDKEGAAFFVNRFGKGMAVHMNFPFYVSMQGAQTPIMRWIAEQAGLHSFGWADSEKGFGIGRFQDGNNYYLIALPPFGYAPEYYRDMSQTSFLRLIEKRHIYDSRAGKYIGHTDAWRPDFNEEPARLYACLPYEVTSLDVDRPQPVKQGDIVNASVRVVTAQGKAGRHVFRVEVFDTQGEHISILGYNQEAPEGRATVEIPLAFNSSPGTWTLRVRDVATGFEKDVPFLLTEKE